MVLPSFALQTCPCTLWGKFVSRRFGEDRPVQDRAHDTSVRLDDYGRTHDHIEAFLELVLSRTRMVHLFRNYELLSV